MIYALTSRSSVAPHASHVHISRLIPSIASGPVAAIELVRRSASFPHEGHLCPGEVIGGFSSAANRRSISSIRSGAARMRFHSPQRSSAASKSWSNDNG